MKKLSSRILALVVALSMLLTSTAFAAERNAANLSVGNFEITIGEDTITLPVTLSVGGGVDIEGIRGYLTADVLTETASALSALAVFENGEIKAHLDGMNYGLSIPLEQAVALLEQEMGMTIEEAMAEIMAEFEGALDADNMAAVSGLAESAAALENVDIAPEELMAALGITLTEQGETTVTLFDVEAAAKASTLTMAPQTLKAHFDAIAALDPALAQYVTEYFAMLDESMAASGEDMTTGELYAMTTIGIDGMIYEAENGMLAELTLAMSIEDETVYIPLYITTLTDEYGTYNQIDFIADADGELVYMSIYADDYSAEGADCINFILSASVGDADSEEADVEFSISFNNTVTAENTGVYLDLIVSEYGTPSSMGIGYIGYPVVSTAETDSYDGLLNVYLNADGMAIDAYASTNLTLANVPDGELLSFDQSVNPLEADEETLSQVVADAQTALLQGLGVLMQDPALAEIISGMMG